MSTTPTPGTPSQPASGWFPSLRGSNLPQAAVNGIQQSFSLLYSLRDTVQQLQTTAGRMLQYGTHALRTQTNPQSMPANMLWFESDRSNVFYQTRIPTSSATVDWFYAGGIYYDSAANRPSDLGPKDTGFLFIDSGSKQLYRWNGSGWDAVQ